MAPVWLIAGDEPMQKLEAVDLIRARALEQGPTERVILEPGEPGFHWSALSAAAASISMFATRRIIELRFGTKRLNKDGGTAISAYLEKRGMEDILIISSPRIEKSLRHSRWFTKLHKDIAACDGIRMDIWPVEADRLPQWIQQRMAGQGKRISRSAALLIAQCVEGNLLAARQEIERLCLLNSEQELDDAQVAEALTDSARFNVFMLIESACIGDIQRATHILRGLRNEGVDPMSLHGALLWELRRLCDMSCRVAAGAKPEQVLRQLNVWNSQRQTAMRRVIQRYSSVELQHKLLWVIRLERRIKSTIGMSHFIWDDIGFFLAGLANKRLPALPELEFGAQ